MKFVAVILAIVAVCCATSPVRIGMGSPAINKDIVHSVNSIRTSWKAGENERFSGKSIDNAKRLLGWNPNPTAKVGMRVVSDVADSLPTSFSSITNWPKCDTIGTIYNQAECGSCWAFGAVEAISDRFCIASKAKINYALSFQDLVSCDDNDDGCEGGDADSAFNYVQTSGLVTDTCYPYGIPTCPPQQQPCLNFVPTPACANQCNNSENWNDVLHYLSDAYDVASNVSAIQTEIMTNGPVEACFTVYEDFLAYKSGVYQYTTGNALGGHCVKIVGWGVENGLPYWLCNNSWTTYWGDNGQFKILSGQDECGIEDNVVGGTPKLD